MKFLILPDFCSVKLLLSQTLLESTETGHAIFLVQLHFVVEFLLGHLAVVVVDLLGLVEHLLLTLPFLRQLLQHLLLLRLPSLLGGLQPPL